MHTLAFYDVLTEYGNLETDYFSQGQSDSYKLNMYLCHICCFTEADKVINNKIFSQGTKSLHVYYSYIFILTKLPDKENM